MRFEVRTIYLPFQSLATSWKSIRMVDLLALSEYVYSVSLVEIQPVGGKVAAWLVVFRLQAALLAYSCHFVCSIRRLFDTRHLPLWATLSGRIFQSEMSLLLATVTWS